MKIYKEVDELLEDIRKAEEKWQKAKNSKSTSELVAAFISLTVTIVAILILYAVSLAWKPIGGNDR